MAGTVKIVKGDKEVLINYCCQCNLRHELKILGLHEFWSYTKNRYPVILDTATVVIDRGIAIMPNVKVINVLK